MLWVNYIMDTSMKGTESIEGRDAEVQFSVLRNIAKTIFSPAGLLDMDRELVLVCDTGMMDTNSEGISTYNFRFSR